MIKFWKPGWWNVRGLEEDFVYVSDCVQRQLLVFHRNAANYSLERLMFEKDKFENAYFANLNANSHYQSFFAGKRQTHPNYEKTMYILEGILCMIGREIKLRERERRKY